MASFELSEEDRAYVRSWLITLLGDVGELINQEEPDTEAMQGLRAEYALLERVIDILR